MSKAQIFFVLLVSFVGGVAAGSWLAFSQTVLYLLFVPPILFIALAWRRNWRLVFIAFTAVIFLLGILRAFDARLNTTFLKKFADTNFPSIVSGYVDSEVKKTASPPSARSGGGGQQFVLRVKKLAVPDFTIPENLNEKILVLVEPFPEYKYGDELTLTGRIALPKNFQDFDYISYLAKDQIYTLIHKPEIEISRLILDLGERSKIWLFKKIFGFKNRFEEAISLAVSEPQAAFINGILLGSRQNIPQDLKNDFATTGVAHILAISGYNITMVSLVVMWFLLFSFRRQTAFWFSVAAIILFTVLTGASASVVRSALMGGLVLLANRSGRIYDPKNSLTLAAFLMVLANPMILRYDIGFQLSFFATMGILYVTPFLSRYFKKMPNRFNFKETFLMTFSAQLMVLPLILFYFHNFSLVALPANLIILPFIPLAMTLGFFTGIAGLIWSKLGLIIGSLAWLVSSLVLWLVRFFAGLSFASFQIFLSWPILILIYATMFVFLWHLATRAGLFSNQ